MKILFVLKHITKKKAIKLLLLQLIKNGSLNPDVWIENARLFGRLVETAEKLAEIELKDEEERTEDENVKLYFQEALREDLSDKEKLEILLDLLFEEEEKEVYLRRYEVNSKL